MESKKKKHKVSEKKVKSVKELAGLMDKYNTVLVGSTMNLASAQLQKARKVLREKSVVKYAKKSVALRAIDASKKEGIDKLKAQVTESPTLIFSNEDPFDLATVLSENKFPARAKAGQLSPKDINVEAGPTDLLPGPIISEFGAVGIKAGIVGGKIAIKAPKVIVKEGEKITSAVASILMKLDILPFEVGLETPIAYDSKNNKVYTGIKIDKAGTLAELTGLFATAYQFAIQVGYPTSENISQIIVNVGREGNALQKVIDEAKPAEQTAEPVAEEKPAEPAQAEKPAAEEKPAEEKKEEAPAEQPVAEAKPAEEKQEKPKEESSSTEPPKEEAK